MRKEMEKSMRSKASRKNRKVKKEVVNRLQREKALEDLVISRKDSDGIPGEAARKLVGKYGSVQGEPFGEEGSVCERRGKRVLRRRKRGENGSVGDNEMWIFWSKGSSPLLDISEGNKLSQDLVQAKKVFWKTSRFSLAPSFPEQATHLVQHQNMLWRSLQHLQRLYQENYLNMQNISDIFNAELHKITQNHPLHFFNRCRENRKTRLAHWTFLRRQNNPHQTLPRFNPQNKHSSVPGLEPRTRGTHCPPHRQPHPDITNIPSHKLHTKGLTAHPSASITNRLRKDKMAPNSEEDSKSPFPNKRGWPTEHADKEPLRPPVYNPEDYAISLKKWGKKGSNGVPIPQYLSQSTGSLEKLSEELCLRKKRQSSPSTKSSSSIKSGDENHSKKDKELTLKTEKKDLKNKENINRGLKSDLQKDFLNPILNLSAHTGEMTLRQFSSVTELLTKLNLDLKLSFPSFVQEFVGDPIDGVTLLLELLRCVQVSQTCQQQRCPPQIVRRALLDEHSCLVCLKHCLRCSDASRRLASSPAGLFTLAVCIMSSVTQSRIIALELLIKACEPEGGGHKAVSEALSTLRLRFGEPVRFRFLVGMLSSAGAVELLTTAMKFINVFVESAPNLQQKVYIQAELEQAGFNADLLRKSLPSNSEGVKVELNKWEKNYFDVEKLHSKVVEANVLQEKVHLLEKRVKILQEEKGILQSLEQCLKERCSELEEEVSIKTNASARNSSMKPFRNCETKQNSKAPEKGESTPAEDEGISSSEQELSQDEDYVKRAIPYGGANDLENIAKLKKVKRGKPSGTETNRYPNKMTTSCNLKNLKNMRSNKMKETNVDDGNEIIPLHGEDEEEEEEETTIDEVIEELENIVNDAETEELAREDRVKVREARSVSVFGRSGREGDGSEGTCRMRRSFVSQEKISFEETEIIPAMLHPQPPKKAKSLVHIYFPGSDIDSHGCNRNEFFEGSDSETSDSLLTGAREEKSSPLGCRRSLEISDSFNSCSSVNTRTLFIKQDQEFEEGELGPRPTYQERNIDEEEIKRKHLKGSLPSGQTVFPEVTFKRRNSQNQISEVQSGVRRTENLNDKINGLSRSCGTGVGFQGVVGKRFGEKGSNERLSPRSPKFAPTPVKRSQTFHITSSDGESLGKKIEMKPKPKMGVRGLDFQRCSEQKVKNDGWTMQVLDYRKSSEKRVEGQEGYSRRVWKEFQRGEESKVDEDGSRLERGSLGGSFSEVKSGGGTAEAGVVKEVFVSVDKLKPAVRARSIEKMDEGLESLVDIVISSDKSKKPKLKSEWNAEVSKNIGPRTRRSLAESSLFCSQLAKNVSKPEEIPKPPTPAQRTSLTRNNSSASPLAFPVEIKVAPLRLNQQQQQPQQSPYFGLKPAKSADNLLTPSQTKRIPPDGSTSPVDLKRNQENQKPSEGRSPVKPNKIQTFFGNPKFNGGSGSDQCATQNYFESNYAAVGNEKKSVSPQPRNFQPPALNAAQEKVKSPAITSNQTAATSSAYKRLGEKDGQTESKPNFLLGTYQSQPIRLTSSKPKTNSSVLQSINSFNKNSYVDKSSTSCNAHSRGRQSSGDVVGSRLSNSGSGKVTDSLSGLY